MKRGVVVECNDDFVTLLTPDGQFLKAKNREGHYELGEEISFFPLMDKREEAATRVRKNYFRSRMARIGAISAVAIIFFMISFLPFFQDDQVYAYMSIDINPSFEVGIDDELNVISLEPLNEEADKLIKEVSNWEGKPFNEIVDDIVAECKEDGYVYPGKEIVITTVVNEEDEKAQNNLQKDINKIRTSYEEDQMVVKTVEADQDTREKAQKQGVSTGKYLELTTKEEKKPIEKKQETTVEQEQPSTSKEIQQESTSSTPNTNEINQQVKNEINSNVKNANAKEKLNEAKEKVKQNIKKRDQKLEQKDNNQDNGRKNGLYKQEQRDKNQNKGQSNRNGLGDDDDDRDNSRRDRDGKNRKNLDDKRENKGNRGQKNRDNNND